MSEKYKVHDQDSPYFVTFAVESWVDVFTRQLYKDLIVDSLRFCQKEKGLIIYAWCLMTNHIHLIVGRNGTETIGSIIRDFKKFTAVHICRAIENNGSESRRLWMLRIFAGQLRTAASIRSINFGKMNIIPWNYIRIKSRIKRWTMFMKIRLKKV